MLLGIILMAIPLIAAIAYYREEIVEVAPHLIPVIIMVGLMGSFGVGFILLLSSLIGVD